MAQTHPLYLLTKQGLLRGDRHEGIDRSYMNLFVVLLQRGVKVHIWNFCGICEGTCCYAKLWVWHVYFKNIFRINTCFRTMYFIWFSNPHLWSGRWYLLQIYTYFLTFYYFYLIGNFLNFFSSFKKRKIAQKWLFLTSYYFKSGQILLPRNDFLLGS